MQRHTNGLSTPVDLEDTETFFRDKRTTNELLVTSVRAFQEIADMLRSEYLRTKSSRVAKQYADVVSKIASLSTKVQIGDETFDNDPLMDDEDDGNEDE